MLKCFLLPPKVEGSFVNIGDDLGDIVVNCLMIIKGLLNPTSNTIFESIYIIKFKSFGGKV